MSEKIVLKNPGMPKHVAVFETFFLTGAPSE